MDSQDVGPSLSASSGNDLPEHDLAEREETYGPLRFRRYAKGDGRGLILYTHGGSAQDSPAQDGPVHE
jgi:hypothetical protein